MSLPPSTSPSPFLKFTLFLVGGSVVMWMWLLSCHLRGFDCVEDDDCTSSLQTCVQGWCESREVPSEGEPIIAELTKDYECPSDSQATLSQPTLLYKADTHIDNLHSDGTYLYWIDQDKNDIYVKEIGSEADAQLWYDGPDTLRNVRPYQQYLYVGLSSKNIEQPNGKIFRLLKPPNKPTNAYDIVKNIESPGDIQINTTHVYWTALTDQSSVPAITLMRVNKAPGSQKEKLFTGRLSAFALGNQYVYWLTGDFAGEIGKMNLSDPQRMTPETVTDKIAEGVDITINDRDIYYTDADGLFKIPKEGGRIQRIDRSGSQLSLDLYYLYFVRSEKLVQASLYCPDSLDRIVKSAFPGQVQHLAQDQQHVYIHVRDNNETSFIYQLKKLYNP
ncbi:MAG TPA: hypothetical protein DCE42_02870 [Myxococcales bacterium]|nr:hypothetical protein [Myxococcales bacterium]